mmetsp:Transcript_53130/g.137246  ORF Transcript_53130/g.137246 Transcript_53130/m.137246 type:complete len:356 (-) Transcript_53130:339-1406(-)
MVRQAEPDIQAREHDDVAHAQEAKEHVGEQEETSVAPVAGEALVAVDADQGAERADDPEHGREELLREVRPLRVLLRRVGVEVERGSTDGDAQGGLDEEEGVDLGDDRPEHQAEADQHHQGHGQRPHGVHGGALVHDAQEAQRDRASENQHAEEHGLLLLREPHARAPRLAVALERGLLQVVLGHRDDDEAHRQQGDEEGHPVAEVLHDGADERHGHQPGELQAEPHVRHQRRTLLGLQTHLLGVLGLRQQVAGGQLQLHHEEADDEPCDAHVFMGHHADRGARGDAKDGGQGDVGRLVIATQGERVADQADDRLHRPGQRGHAAIDLHLWPSHLVGGVEVLDARTSEGRREPLH